MKRQMLAIFDFGSVRRTFIVELNHLPKTTLNLDKYNFLLLIRC